jgi:hypothetical protein
MIRPEYADTTDEILRFIQGRIEDVTSDLDIGPISHDRRLGDLELESITLVLIISQVQRRYGLQDLLFKSMVVSGKKIVEMTVIDIANLTSKIISVMSSSQPGA